MKTLAELCTAGTTDEELQTKARAEGVCASVYLVPSEEGPLKVGMMLCDLNDIETVAYVLALLIAAAHRLVDHTAEFGLRSGDFETQAQMEQWKTEVHMASLGMVEQMVGKNSTTGFMKKG